VRVRLLVPGKSDIPVASYAGRSFFYKAFKGRIEIHTYLGDMLHAKTYLFDQCWGIVGSTNLDTNPLCITMKEILESWIHLLLQKWPRSLRGPEKFYPDRRKDLAQKTFFRKIKEHFFALFKKRL